MTGLVLPIIIVVTKLHHAEGHDLREEDQMIVSKNPYRGYHLIVMRENGRFLVRILDGSNNAVQPELLSLHSTEEGALDEARQKVDFLIGQHRV